MMCSDHEKTKTTFTLIRKVFEGGLPIYLCIFFCSDINECVRGLHKCSSNAFCNDTKGSYNCTCKHGFTGNGRECKGSCLIY